MDYLTELYTRVFWLFIATAGVGVIGMAASHYLEKKKKKPGHDQETF